MRRMILNSFGITSGVMKPLRAGAGYLAASLLIASLPASVHAANGGASTQVITNTHISAPDGDTYPAPE